jgi:nucleotidyltransferase/DNA polymerase involved in DNA repair
MYRVSFHLEMDGFYASVEQRDNSSLKGKPVIDGSPPTQGGVVCAASHEARKFGVGSAMPSATAGRPCPASGVPEWRLIAPNRTRSPRYYRFKSKKFFVIL